MANEADTCRKFVVPKLQAGGWDDEPHSIAEQRTFTDGRIIVVGDKTKRHEKKRADYLLRYTRDFPIAVVEAKAAYKSPGDGMQQAKDYAEILGLRFCYATNGHGILEFDFTTGIEREVEGFPTPEEPWARFQSVCSATDVASMQPDGMNENKKHAFAGPKTEPRPPPLRARFHVLNPRQRTSYFWIRRGL